MTLKANKLSLVVLVILSLTWTSVVQAFFCFSMGGGNKGRHRYYPAPPPYAGFSAGSYPVFPYSPVRMVPLIRPNRTVEEEMQDTRPTVPEQHIFK
jgi:hypothetical protein